MSSSRPFSILGLQQIAVGGADKHSLRRFWVDLLGLTHKDSFWLDNCVEFQNNSLPLQLVHLFKISIHIIHIHIYIHSHSHMYIFTHVCIHTCIYAVGSASYPTMLRAIAAWRSRAEVPSTCREWSTDGS